MRAGTEQKLRSLEEVLATLEEAAGEIRQGIEAMREGLEDGTHPGWLDAACEFNDEARLVAEGALEEMKWAV